MSWLSALLAWGLETLDAWPGAALLAYVRVRTGTRTETKHVSCLLVVEGDDGYLRFVVAMSGLRLALNAKSFGGNVMPF
jgi:hypothetical protein